MSEVLNKKEEMTIDVKNMPLGRAASAVASALRNKNETDFAPNEKARRIVKVRNVKQLKIGEKKALQKMYKRYTGYPSGLRKTPLGELFAKSPEEVFAKAVKGMLPKNKLQKGFLKNLRYID